MFHGATRREVLLWALGSHALVRTLLARRIDFDEAIRRYGKS